MDNLYFSEDAFKYWAQKKFWSMEDVLNIHFGGLENVSPQDSEEVDKVIEFINQAVAYGELKTVNGIVGVLFKRHEIIKWAKENLKSFPFELSDFEKVKKVKRPGSDNEETQLRIIGALGLLLAHKSGKYQKGISPNSSAIASAATDLVTALGAEIPKLNGLGEANFRETISRGVESLTDKIASLAKTPT